MMSTKEPMARVKAALQLHETNTVESVIAEIQDLRRQAATKPNALHIVLTTTNNDNATVYRLNTATAAHAMVEKLRKDPAFKLVEYINGRCVRRWGLTTNQG